MLEALEFDLRLRYSRGEVPLPPRWAVNAYRRELLELRAALLQDALEAGLAAVGRSLLQ